MQLRLADTFHEIDDVVTFVWETEEPVSWQAGQFIKYTLPHEGADDRGTSRWFTIAAPPFEGRPRITTRITPDKGSTFKSALLALTPGDTIEAGRPAGDFVVEDAARPMVLLAGGIGVTPYRAILKQLDHDGAAIRASLLYANRTEPFVFGDELRSLSDKHPGLDIQWFTDPRRIELADLQTAADRFENPLYYLSGPEPMVEHYQQLLRDAGTDEQDIKTDFFPGYEA